MHAVMTREKMKPNLEDYIYDVQSRSLEPSADPQDVYALLQQKEKDLILAAELGKALLEKNEELSKQNEKLAEDYSYKLEVIEQDRHSLRRKLTTLQAEHEAKIIDLQGDIKDLKIKLQERETNNKQIDKEKNDLIQELTEQNQRLQAQLRECAKMEEQLQVQVLALKDQLTMRRTTFQDHQSSLDVLRDEILMMSEKKIELEKRVAGLSAQRDNLSQSLEEASDKIMLLERQMMEQKIQMRVGASEVEELRAANGALGERLRAIGAGVTPHPRSLHSEMECDDVALPEGDELHQIKVEIVSIYDRVRALCHSLRQRSQTSTEGKVRPDITVHQAKVGLLTSIIQELTDLLSDVGPGDFSNSSVSVTDLEIELHRCQEAIDKMSKDLEAKSEELKKRSETILELTSKLSCIELELNVAREERDRAISDLKDCTTGSARDEILRKAWEVRDGAVGRKNAIQIELARTRIEVMQANSQLIEAIQQKVELSQQLEQWQMDMHALLDEQMRKKLANPEQASSGQSSPSSAEKKRASKLLFGIFNR